MSNGDEASKEGYKYRGFGCIQLTRKESYRKFAEAIKDHRIVDDPDLVASTYALLSADWFWLIIRSTR